METETPQSIPVNRAEAFDVCDHSGMPSPHEQTQPTSNPELSVPRLQAIWHRLLDPERAKAIVELHGNRVSYRNLARALDCSDTLLRQLVKILDADLEDLELAQHAQISTREARRRAARARARRDAAARQREADQRGRDLAVAPERVLRWLAREGEASPNAELILVEARYLMAGIERTEGVAFTATFGSSDQEEVIRRTRPEGRDAFSIAWCASWLVNWLNYSYPFDRRVRRVAASQALRLVATTGWRQDFGTRLAIANVNHGPEGQPLHDAA